MTGDANNIKVRQNALFNAIAYHGQAADSHSRLDANKIFAAVPFDKDVLLEKAKKYVDDINPKMQRTDSYIPFISNIMANPHLVGDQQSLAQNYLQKKITELQGTYNGYADGSIAIPNNSGILVNCSTIFYEFNENRMLTEQQANDINSASEKVRERLTAKQEEQITSILTIAAENGVGVSRTDDNSTKKSSPLDKIISQIRSLNLSKASTNEVKELLGNFIEHCGTKETENFKKFFTTNTRDVNLKAKNAILAIVNPIFTRDFSFASELTKNKKNIFINIYAYGKQ